MKAKSIWLATTLMITLLFALGYALNGSSTLGQDTDGLTLEVQPDQSSYLPGEMIALRFRVMNTSSTSISVGSESTVWDGNLKVFIAYEDGPFKEYFGPGWGTKDRVAGQPVSLAQGQTFETEATILWNHKVETSHLNPAYAKDISEKRLNTDYALTKSGTYSIKAVLNNIQTGNKVESAPVVITVEEPQGEDLEVWKKIKEDANYGLLIQTGGLAEQPKGPKTTRIAVELEEILSRHPNSRYSKDIRSGLTKRQNALKALDPDKQLDE